MEELVLCRTDNLLQIADAAYFLIPSTTHEQITCVSLVVRVSGASGSLEWRAGPSARPSDVGHAFCDSVARCFPKTEAVVESLHGEEVDSDDSSSPVEGAKPRSFEGLKRFEGQIVTDSEERKMAASFAGCAPGEFAVVFFSMIHRRPVLSKL
jgi:hypothetical protein